MGDFIRMCSEWFDTVLRVITSFLESIAALVIALTNIYTGLTESIGFFPSFLGGIMIGSVCLIILLRIVGR